MVVFLQPTTVRDPPTMVRTVSVGVLSYTSQPSLRAFSFAACQALASNS
jgi:hypothetical protein